MEQLLVQYHNKICLARSAVRGTAAACEHTASHARTPAVARPDETDAPSRGRPGVTRRADQIRRAARSPLSARKLGRKTDSDAAASTADWLPADVALAAAPALCLEFQPRFRRRPALQSEKHRTLLCHDGSDERRHNVRFLRVVRRHLNFARCTR